MLYRSVNVLRQECPCYEQDPISTAAYLWSVGYADARHLEVLEAIIDVFLVRNVQMCRALVQKEYSWLPIERSSEHYSLPAGAMQGPRYTTLAKLQSAKSVADLLAKG
jgi:hypothetical protein